LSAWQRTQRAHRTGKLRGQLSAQLKGHLALTAIGKQDGPKQMIRKVFDELDADHSGFMDKSEFTRMIKTCGGRKRKSKEITEIFKRLDDGDDGTPGQISFEQFETWFVEEMKSDVRAARVLARQLFQLADADGSGTLSRSEFSRIAHNLEKKFPHVKLDPPFDLHKDWEVMIAAAEKTPDGFAPEDITWDDFERWWRERAGDDEGTVPVLPEAMVARVAELNVGTNMAQLVEDNPGDTPSQRHWAYLKPRLVQLLQMQTVWGNVGNLYGSADSGYGNALDSLPVGVRSPESQFTQTWDLLQLVCIVYIAVAVPLRMGFNLVAPSLGNIYAIRIHQFVPGFGSMYDIYIPRSR